MNDALAVKSEKDITNLTKYSDEERNRITEIARMLSQDDSQSVVTYGVGAQKDVSDFADNILNDVKQKDSGYVGDILGSLVHKVKDLNVNSLSHRKSFLSYLPLIGGLFDTFGRFISRYDTLSMDIEKIVDNLDTARMSLLKDIAMMDTLYDRNLQYVRIIDLYIAAGQIRLDELHEKFLPVIEEKAESSGDPLDAQRLQDFNQFLGRIEKKLHDLKLSRMVAVQTAPQLRLIQNGNQALVEKIQSSVLNTIPLWKNQIVIAIALMRQQKAVKLQKQVTDTTNELLKQNAEMLKSGASEIAREAERGIVEIDTLKKVNADLIATIEDTLKIQQEGRQKRQQAETELVKLEQDLKEKLTSISSRASQPDLRNKPNGSDIVSLK